MNSKKHLDLSKSVYDLSKAYPDIVGIMADLGFADIVKPGMISTAGRFMTIPKGARLKGIDFEQVRIAYKSCGYVLMNSASQSEGDHHE